MRQSRPSLLLPLLNRIDWHSMTSPLAESADTWSRTFSSEIPVSVAISESSRSPRSFRYFRISCKADAPHAFPGCVCTPKRSSILRQIGPSCFPSFHRRAGGLGGARAGLPSVPLRELLRTLGRPGHVLLPSFPPSPGLQHLGVCNVSQMSQDGPPIIARLEWGDSVTRFGALG